MADCFISYRRIPSAPVATALQSKLESRHNIDAYVDTTRTDGTKVRFPERLMTAIADAPVFICLLGERDGQHTLESEWVLKEIQQAYDLQKFCIPVFQESYRPLPDMPAAVDYLLGFEGVHILDQKNIMIDESVRQLAELIQPHIRKRRLSWITLLVILLVVTVVGAFVVLTQLNENINPEFIPNPTTAVAQSITEAPTDAFTLTLSSFEVLQTTEAELTHSAGTQTAFELTLTEQFISDSNATATAAQFTATETAAFATLLALSATPTQTTQPVATNTPRPTNTLDPLQAAFVPVTRNNDWTPIEREFQMPQGGIVTMVLVPAGCFMMGSTDEQIIYARSLRAGDFASNEQPAHEQCFDEPFWIDKYEVTNEQYGSTGCYDWGLEPDQPRNCVNWFEARNFCEARGGRLPTEAEWEYAARGPDGLIYPWGNEFIADNVVYEANSGNQTAVVGSYPSGASWVGALDMAGNVWEWTSTLFEPHPYNANDGREIANSNSARVLRSSSYNFPTEYMRSALRLSNFPGIGYGIYGLRCARSLE